MQHWVMYKGHKIKHAIKFHALMTPDGLILHACSPIEVERHDWTLYLRSGLDELLVQFCPLEGSNTVYAVIVDTTTVAS